MNGKKEMGDAMTDKKPLRLTDIGMFMEKAVRFRGKDLDAMSFDELKQALIEVIRLARSFRMPWQERMFYVIMMPLDVGGRGPASIADGDAREITWEVWDQNCTSHGTYNTLEGAMLRAEECNDKFGHCIDEGCPHYGTPHTHSKTFASYLTYKEGK